jgi:hypothetical protein
LILKLKYKIPNVVKLTIRDYLDVLGFDSWKKSSWSQEGEDQILRRIFSGVHSGFYVDIGAHHPKRYSNTYLFYKLGWTGLNIDAMPGSMRSFQRTRPRDVNVEMGVALVPGERKYYIFNEPALNGFSEKVSMERNSSVSAYEIIDVKSIRVEPLSKILDSYLMKECAINFMSIDVEGLDLEVLKSNDWNKYRPEFVLVEILKSNFFEIERSEIGMFMQEREYSIYAKCVNTVFFKRNEPLANLNT